MRKILGCREPFWGRDDGSCVPASRHARGCAMSGPTELHPQCALLRNKCEPALPSRPTVQRSLQLSDTPCRSPFGSLCRLYRKFIPQKQTSVLADKLPKYITQRGFASGGRAERLGFGQFLTQSGLRPGDARRQGVSLRTRLSASSPPSL